MLENFTYNFDSDLILSVSFILCKILSKAKSKHFQSFLLIPKSFTKSTTNLNFQLFVSKQKTGMIPSTSTARHESGSQL